MGRDGEKKETDVFTFVLKDGTKNGWVLSSYLQEKRIIGRVSSEILMYLKVSLKEKLLHTTKWGCHSFVEAPTDTRLMVPTVSLASVARPAWKSNVVPAWNFKDRRKRLTSERPADLF